MNREKIFGNIQLILVIVFIIGSMAISKILENSYQPPAKNSEQDRILYVESKEFSPQNYRLKFQTSGVVEARDRVKIIPEVSGRVISIDQNFFDGGNFQKNKAVFQIDPKDFILEVQKSEAEIEKARTAYKLERAESNSAILEWRQINKNKEIPELVARKPQLQEAMANLRAAKAGFENAILDLRRTSYVLPFDGKVVNSDIAVGQYLTSSQNYGEVISNDSLEIKSSLSDQELKWLMASNDPKVKIKFDKYGEVKEYDGYLKRSASNLDKDTRFGTVYFGFRDNFEDILDGSFVEIEVMGQNLENVMLIDAVAIQNGEKIFAIENSQLKELKAEIISYEKDFVVVKGINKSVKIVTSKINGGYDGMKIEDNGKE